MTWEGVGAVALRLPGVEASTSYGTPAYKVNGKLLVRLKEDGASVVLIAANMDEKELLLEAAPEVFFQTDHYRGYASFLARLETLDEAELGRLLEQTWRRVAPKSLQKASPIPPAG